MVVRIQSIPIAYSLVALYLAAIVAANLLVTAFGPSIVIVTSFFLIGLDLSSRDSLHDAWQGRALWPKMAMLIAAGSLLSWLLNSAAVPIALASFLAFALAGAVDALVYHLLRGRGSLARMNGSNAVSAFADSAVFLSLLAALAGLPWSSVPLLVAGQWGAKVAGGFLWSVVLHRVSERYQGWRAARSCGRR